jgi:DNA polymerase-3 subunit beta
MIVNIKKNSLMLDLNGTIIISRLLEGNFIDYERLIVNSFNSSFVVPKAPIKNCLDRVSIIAKDNKNVIDTSVKKDSVNINAQSEIGNIDESILIDLKGSEVNIGFNFKNILDVVNAIEEDFIQFDLNDSVKPCFIRPVDNNDILYMVLPIRR